MRYIIFGLCICFTAYVSWKTGYEKAKENITASVYCENETYTISSNYIDIIEEWINEYEDLEDMWLNCQKDLARSQEEANHNSICSNGVCSAR